MLRHFHNNPIANRLFNAIVDRDIATVITMLDTNGNDLINGVALIEVTTNYWGNSGSTGYINMTPLLVAVYEDSIEAIIVLLARNANNAARAGNIKETDFITIDELARRAGHNVQSIFNLREDMIEEWSKRIGESARFSNAITVLLATMNLANAPAANPPQQAPQGPHP